MRLIFESRFAAIRSPTENRDGSLYRRRDALYILSGTEAVPAYIYMYISGFIRMYSCCNCFSNAFDKFARFLFAISSKSEEATQSESSFILTRALLQNSKKSSREDAKHMVSPKRNVRFLYRVTLDSLVLGISRSVRHNLEIVSCTLVE